MSLVENIKLNDILKIENLDNVKIRLNLSNASWNALELYHNNPDLLLIGNFHNSTKKRWFKENQIVIGLAQIKNDDWLLIDISIITKSYNNFWDGVTHSNVHTFYEHDKLSEFEKYCGRLIVQFHKNNAYVTLSGNSIDDFIVKEILPSSLDKDLFPGYDKVNISWETMKRVLEKDIWKTALENQKGVYLITDISNGKKYVGKASGEHMILGRWKSYIRTGHGDNVELKKLPFDYIKKNFRYSILDIYKSSTNDQIITDREGWWKEVLLSRQEQYGYNKN
ncbi:MAG: GIY-YIG nuclease family protein [Bacteroidota bacterium]|nr:MAG: GIY-YIG nuclease family protein [Bacteroidota bacterium]